MPLRTASPFYRFFPYVTLEVDLCDGVTRHFDEISARESDRGAIDAIANSINGAPPVVPDGDRLPAREAVRHADQEVASGTGRRVPCRGEPAASANDRHIYRAPERFTSQDVGVSTDDARARWESDESLLAHIGAYLFPQATEVEVRVARDLADKAVAAWQRDDDGVPPDETCEERIVRTRAAALALIGCALEERGRADGDEVVVKLDAWFIGDALHAADDHGLVQP